MIGKKFQNRVYPSNLKSLWPVIFPQSSFFNKILLGKTLITKYLIPKLQ